MRNESNEVTEDEFKVQKSTNDTIDINARKIEEMTGKHNFSNKIDSARNISWEIVTILSSIFLIF